MLKKEKKNIKTHNNNNYEWRG